MNPMILGLGAIGLGWFGYTKLSKPKASDFQSQTVTGAGGVPLKILTPISKTVTAGQAQGKATPAAPTAPGTLRAPAVAQVVPGQGTVYAPPKMVTVSSAGSVQLAPIVISPTGASSVAIGEILDIQRALNTLGFTPKLKEDGKFGPATSANIKAFQRKAGLSVDGNAGPATKAGLSNALANLIAGGPTAPIAAAATKAVAAGTAPTISTAKDVQHGLNLLGAKPPLAEDGKPGPKTIAAIKSFQLTHGLTVDGVAGAKTKTAIGLALGMPVQTPNVAGEAQNQFSCGFG
jgi:peptidoglycan hydrolase-like protein with peptidoglycan-binding domain